MKMVASNMRQRWKYCCLLLTVLSLAGCSRAPSVDIVGSFFPSWLVCLAIAIVFTAVVRWALLRLRVKVAYPVLIYPSLVALLTFAMWLIFFY